MLKLSRGIPKAADSHGLLVGYNPTTVNLVVYFVLDFAMKLALIVFSVCLFLTPIANSRAQEWVSLFNGKNLDGWVQRGGKAKYSVEDGVIVGETVPNTPNSFLCTERNYDNFELELEFKVHPELNSGVQIRSNSLPDYKNGRVHGYQVEIDPSERAWSAGIYDESRRGWICDLKDNTKARYAFKQDQWNHYRIVANGDSIKTWINGVPAADLVDDLTATGFIALQVHGVGGRKDPISVLWRNIKLKELNADNPQPADKAPQKSDSSVFKMPGDGDVKMLGDGFRFTEGPSWGPEGKMFFTDIPNERIHAMDLDSGESEVYRADSGKANGLVWTPNDALIACEGGARRVTIQSKDGVIRTIVDQFEDKKLNSPNDITLDGTGGFYFTDPRYGNRDDMEMEVEGVYYVNRRRQLSRVVDDLERPNGVQLSNDGKILYVADTGANRVFAYDVGGPGKLSNKREFAGIGSDGMTIDQYGNLYLTHGPAVHIYSPQGEAVGQIDFPTAPANVTFGGEDNKTLFVTGRTAVYAVELDFAGGQVYSNAR